MTEYRAGIMARIDLFIGGFPKCRVIEVIEPGDGKRVANGIIKVRLLESCTGYKNGEILEGSASDVVPLRHVRYNDFGQPMINTLYKWVK